VREGDSVIYRWLADAVVLLHLGFILFVVFGALAAARHRVLLPLHLAAAAWGVAIEAAGGACPLTGIEIRLRLLAGEAGYGGGFVEHYLLSIIYPFGLTRGLQYGLAAAVFAINAVLYTGLLRRG
jgi:hypothetical protein